MCLSPDVEPWWTPDPTTATTATMCALPGVSRLQITYRVGHDRPSPSCEVSSSRVRMPLCRSATSLAVKRYRQWVRDLVAIVLFPGRLGATMCFVILAPHGLYFLGEDDMKLLPVWVLVFFLVPYHPFSSTSGLWPQDSIAYRWN
jgi:hypothetical protein